MLSLQKQYEKHELKEKNTKSTKEQNTSI